MNLICQSCHGTELAVGEAGRPSCCANCGGTMIHAPLPSTPQRDTAEPGFVRTPLERERVRPAKPNFARHWFEAAHRAAEGKR